MPRLKIDANITDKIKENLSSLIKKTGGITKLMLYLRDFNPTIMPQNISAWLRFGRIPPEYILYLNAKSKGEVALWDLSPHIYPKQMFKDVDPMTAAAVKKLYNGQLYKVSITLDK